jgi:Nif-specific regulatory protein
MAKMSEVVAPPSLAELQQEHELFRRLLDLGACEAIETFLAEILALVAQISRARKAYLELYDDGADPTGPALTLAHGCEGEAAESFRAGVSHGVIAEAVATRATIVTASAIQDPRFRDLGSVRRHRIEAVLCAPIGFGAPIGVIYLQQRADGGSFGEADRLQVQRFARHVAPFAERLLLRRRQRQIDPTAAIRGALKAESVIGSSPALARLLQEVALVAPLEVCVLLTGESGTGKTQLARVIHDSGPRRGGPFVELNCAALPDTLIEAELFGAMPGAHSTATRKIDGKIAAAAGGTLFLDEIGELQPSAQSKLLQLLQSRQYYPLGASQPVVADIRVLAATNVDLQAAIARKAFRDDLYYRLSVLPIRVPALAERREDLQALADHFCQQACARNRLPTVRLSLAARHAVMTADWTGNVRQLANTIEGAAIRAAGSRLAEIEPHHLFPGRSDGQAARVASFQEATRAFQEKLVRQALEETGWNVTETARLLDLSRAHTYNLISAFGLARRGR